MGNKKEKRKTDSSKKYKKNNNVVKSNLYKKGSTTKTHKKSSNIKIRGKNNKVRVSDKKNRVSNKNSNENSFLKQISIRKIVTLIILICIIIVCGIIFNKPKEQGGYEFNKINYNTYLELFNSENISYIYIVKDNCSECLESKNNIVKLESEMNIKINELNISSLTIDECKNIYSGIGTPVLISVTNGKVIKEESATRGYNVLKSFVINSKEHVDTYSFNKINVNEYIKLLNSKDLTYIYICSSSQCKEENRILDSVSSSKKFKVNFLDIDEIATDSDWDLLNNSNEIFRNTWFVPVNIIVKNGNIKSYRMEVLDIDGLNEFLEENGM